MKRLKTLRKQYGFSQKELAKLTGISQSVISDIENGKRSKSYENFKILANIFNVTIDELDQSDHPNDNS